LLRRVWHGVPGETRFAAETGLSPVANSEILA